jgi:hypothetical protein
MLPVGGPRTRQPFASHQQCWIDITAPEKNCSRHHHSARLSGLRDPTQFLSQPSQWSSRLKPSIYWRQTTRLTGPINTCMWSVRSILAHGYQPSVLNRHRWGLPHRNLRITTILSLPFPSKCSTDPPNGLAQSQIIHTTIINWTGEGTSPKSHEWEPPLCFYRNLTSKHIITNGKPTQDGVTRINRKVNLKCDYGSIQLL